MASMTSQGRRGSNFGGPVIAADFFHDLLKRLRFGDPIESKPPEISRQAVHQAALVAVQCVQSLNVGFHHAVASGLEFFLGRILDRV
jgi:hypothetical protein